MKILSILATVLLFLSACSSLPAKNINSTLTLPKPEIKYVNIKDADHVTMGWDPVPVSEDNPILGFKFKMWETEFRNITISREENGKIVNSIGRTLLKKSEEPTFETTVRPDVFQVTFGGIRQSVTYYFTVQAYNSDGDGPPSVVRSATFMKFRLKY